MCMQVRSILLDLDWGIVSNRWWVLVVVPGAVVDDDGGARGCRVHVRERREERESGGGSAGEIRGGV